jgi:hypothetical protein
MKFLCAFAPFAPLRSKMKALPPRPAHPFLIAPKRLSTLFPAMLWLFWGAPSSAPAADPPGLIKDQPNSGRFVKTDAGYMVPYQQTIPGSDVAFEMQPIADRVFASGLGDPVVLAY